MILSRSQQIPRLTALAILLAAAASARDIRWQELESAVKHKHVEITLPNGGTASGKALRVDPGAFFLMEGSSERQIPRTGLKEITVTRSGKLFRILFVTWGALTVLGGAVETGGKGMAAGIAIGAGGFVLGDYLDHRKTRLIVVD